MKVGDLVEWALDGDVGIIVRTMWSKVQVHWAMDNQLEWMWEDQDGLKLIQKNP